MPAAAVALLRTDKDWDHSSGYEPHCDNRRITLPRGRVLGGTRRSTSWSTSAGTGSTTTSGATSAARAGAGRTCCAASSAPRTTSAAPTICTASAGRSPSRTGARGTRSRRRSWTPASTTGCAANHDFNGPEQDGVGWYQVTQRDGLRCSTAAGYLHPVMNRPNLHVETGVQVSRSCSTAPAPSACRARATARWSSSAPRAR